MAGRMLARRRLQPSLLALAALLVPVAAFVPSLPARARPPSRAVPVDVETSEDYEWYILQCYVGNEVWCAATIEEILGKPEHVEQRSRVETILVPTEKVASTRGRKVYHKEKIIYPGYVFCRLRMEQEQGPLVNTVSPPSPSPVLMTCNGTDLELRPTGS